MKKLPGILLSTIFLGFTYSSSQAAGFAILEQSTLGLGSAFAGTAVSVDDASTIYFNPAGMVKLDQQVIAASTVILPKAEFSNKSSSTASALGPLGGDLSGDNAAGERSAVVPNFYAVFPVNRSLSAGIGINAPFGLATEYDDNWVGRYHAVESDVRTININPSVALRISPQFTIGAGLNIQQMNVVLSNAIDFASICIAQLNASTCNLLGVAGPQQADGFVQFEGNNNSELGVGWNFGMLAELSSKTRVGLAYRSEVKQHLTGNADFTVPGNVSFLTNTGLFNDGGISADVTLPKNLTLSFMQNLMPKLDLLADVSWTNWAVFDELRIKYDNGVQPDSATTESWRDSTRVSLGGVLEYSKAIDIRFGVAYDQTPIPNAELRTARVPGNDRTWLAFGFSYEESKDLRFDFAYSHLFIDDTEINNTFESSVPTLAATLNGQYQAQVDIVSAQLRWQF